MKNLLLQPTPLSQWYCAVSEAHQAAPVELDLQSESYLVFLLHRFTDKPDVLQSVIALDFLKAAHQQGALREHKLREIGDKCLLLAGLFPQRASRRCLRISYFVDLGMTAFDALSDSEFNTLDNHTTFHDLANTFVPMMDVLHTLRSFSRDESVLTAEEASDLWQQTGSLYAFNVLKQYQPL